MGEIKLKIYNDILSSLIFNSYNIYKYSYLPSGFEEVISYTTRPKRTHEFEGKEHYFITNEQATEIMKTKEVVAKTKIGEYIYFTTLDEIKNKDIYIIDPNGIRYLKTCNYADQFIFQTIYIYSSLDCRLGRAYYRGDNLNVFYKRNESEDQQFLDFESDRSNIDLYLGNSHNDSFNIVERIKELVKFMVDRIYEYREDSRKLLFLVVGRSNAGKDTMMQYAKGILNFLSSNSENFRNL